MLTTARKVYFLNYLWQPIKCFENSNPVIRNSSLFETVNYLYLNAILQTYNKLSIWLKPIPTASTNRWPCKACPTNHPVYPSGKKNKGNLHWTICEIRRAVLVSLHVSLPCARSCFTCNANRYLQNKREQRATQSRRESGESIPTCTHILESAEVIWITKV